MRKFTKMMLAFFLFIGIGMGIGQKSAQKVEAATPVRVYLDLGTIDWGTANADIRCYAWNADVVGDNWITDPTPGTSMNVNGEGKYYIDLADTPTGLQFNRCQPGTGSVWNSTGDQTYSSSTNCFKLTGWNSGSWTNYTEPTTAPVLSLAGTLNSWNAADETTDLVYDEVTKISSITITTTDAVEFKIVRNHGWTLSIGYSYYDPDNSTLFKDTIVRGTVIDGNFVITDKGIYTINVNTETSKVSVIETAESIAQKTENDAILGTAYQVATSEELHIRLLSMINLSEEGKLESITSLGFEIQLRYLNADTVKKTAIETDKVYNEIDENTNIVNVSERFEGFTHVFAYAILNIPDGVEITYRSFVIIGEVTTFSNTRVLL